MTADPEAVRRMLHECWTMPSGAARVALADQAIRYADALDDPDLAFDARMIATEAYQRGGEPARTFVTFAWCLAEYDRHPDRYQRWYKLLLWHFKYVVGSLTSFPEVPLDRTYAVLDDMQRRYQAGGHSLHAVYQYRWRVAAHVGDHEAADEWYQKWFTAPRDENSDCVGCDPTAKVAHLAASGRDEEAVALAEPVLAGTLTCVEQPQAILTELLLPYLRTGRLKQAVNAHRRAYRALRDNRADLAEIAEHLHFCAVTGNQARGLELLERHLQWLERPPSPFAEMRFAAAGALVLRRLTETGHGDQEVAKTGKRVAELKEELAARATALAARFDERNGTSHQSTLIGRLLAAEPLVDYLPLSPTAARLHAHYQQRTATAAPPLEPVAPDAPLEELLREVERRLTRDDLDGATALWTAMKRRHAPDDLPADARGRWDEVYGLVLAQQDDLTGAIEAWRRAEAVFGELGDEVHRQLALGRIGLARCLLDRCDTGGAEQVESSTAYLVAHADPERKAGALHRLATVRLLQSRPDDALTVLDEATGYAEAAGDPLLSAEIAAQRVRCLLACGRPELGETAARVRAQCRAAGSPHLSEMAVQHGFVLLDSGDLEAALDAFDEALRSATDPARRFGALFARGQALSRMDRIEEALADLVEAVAIATEIHLHGDEALARFELARTYRQAGRLLDAAETGEEAVAALDRLGAQELADQCRYLLVTVYRELGETEPALALLDTLATNLDGFDNLVPRSAMHEEAADLLYQADRDREAVDRYETAATGFRAAGDTVGYVRARRKQLVALRWSGRPQEALEALPAVEAAAAELDADRPDAAYERAKLRYEGALLLATMERELEALERIDGVAEPLRALGAVVDAAMAELLHADLLVRFERLEPAVPRLRAALPHLPRGSDPGRHAAQLLADTLRRLGREAEAAEVRDEYGVTE